MTAIFSLEMSYREVCQRFLCAESGVPYRPIRRPRFLKDQHFGQLALAADRLAKYDIEVIDDSNINAHDIASRCRYLKIKRNLGLVIVDYLQLVHGKSDEDREREVSGIGWALKELSKQLTIPILALSQVNDDGRIRESRAVAHHADLVLKIEVEDEQHVIQIQKNRFGATDSVPCVFLKSEMRFVNAAHT